MRACLGNFLQILCAGVAEMARFGDDHVEIAQILDFMPEFLQLLVEIGVTKGRGSHVDTAPVRAQVHWDADDRNLRHALSFHYCISDVGCRISVPKSDFRNSLM